MITSSPLEIRKKFRRLRNKWWKETSYFSWTVEDHSAYQEILILAEDHRDEIVTLMLEDMQPCDPILGHTRRFYSWFIALSRLTGALPVPFTHRGRVQTMAECWLQWGKINGYL